MLTNIRVECHCGYRGEETPRRFWIEARCVEVEQVLDCWLAPDHRYFKVMGADGDIYILRHDPYGHDWELIFFSKQPPGSDNTTGPPFHGTEDQS